MFYYYYLYSYKYVDTKTWAINLLSRTKMEIHNNFRLCVGVLKRIWGGHMGRLDPGRKNFKSSNVWKAFWYMIFGQWYI